MINGVFWIDEEVDLEEPLIQVVIVGLISALVVAILATIITFLAKRVAYLQWEVRLCTLRDFCCEKIMDYPESKRSSVATVQGAIQPQGGATQSQGAIQSRMSIQSRLSVPMVESDLHSQRKAIELEGQIFSVVDLGSKFKSTTTLEERKRKLRIYQILAWGVFLSAVICSAFIILVLGMKFDLDDEENSGGGFENMEKSKSFLWLSSVIVSEAARAIFLTPAILLTQTVILFFFADFCAAGMVELLVDEDDVVAIKAFDVYTRAVFGYELKPFAHQKLVEIVADAQDTMYMKNEKFEKSINFYSTSSSRMSMMSKAGIVSSKRMSAYTARMSRISRITSTKTSKANSEATSNITSNATSNITSKAASRQISRGSTLTSKTSSIGPKAIISESDMSFYGDEYEYRDLSDVTSSDSELEDTTIDPPIPPILASYNALAPDKKTNMYLSLALMDFDGFQGTGNDDAKFSRRASTESVETALVAVDSNSVAGSVAGIRTGSVAAIDTGSVAGIHTGSIVAIDTGSVAAVETDSVAADEKHVVAAADSVAAVDTGSVVHTGAVIIETGSVVDEKRTSEGSDDSNEVVNAGSKEGSEKPGSDGKKKKKSVAIRVFPTSPKSTDEAEVKVEDVKISHKPEDKHAELDSTASMLLDRFVESNTENQK